MFDSLTGSTAQQDPFDFTPLSVGRCRFPTAAVSWKKKKNERTNYF